MPERLPFNHWMKQLRAALDLTQEALAEMVGCAPQTIRSYESGRRRPSRELAERLATILRVPAEHRSSFIQATRAVNATSSIQDHTTAQVDAPKPAERTASPAAGPVARSILTTKLYRPRPRAGLVSRPRLIARLVDGLSRQLTLIAAPAGFGKTTVLVDWLSQTNPAIQHIAWLGLDTGDSDPLQFLRYVIAALQTIEPAVGATLLPLLQTTQPPRVETLMALLVQDLLLLPAGSILVLDDYHVIDAPALHQAITFLLDHLPLHMHLVISTRVDPPLPLARLRARGELTELRSADLRFTLDESAAFLKDVMDLPLTAADVAVLEGRTEGWVAGLHLAALSLRDRSGAQRTQFIDAFAGSHRFVVDYLVDEVLSGQPAYLQAFLLQTSILERFSSPLCDTVMFDEGTAQPEQAIQRDRMSGQAILEQLERSNLFIVPLDDERRWYRYHHLFAQVLRERLVSGARPEVVAALYRRASAWFEQQGLLDEAVRQAFAGNDIECAVDLIERHSLPLIERSEHVLVWRWVDQLPRTLLETRPQLAIVAGWILVLIGRFEALDHLCQAVMRAPEAAHAAVEVLGELASIRATAARFQEQYTSALELAHEALRLLPQDQPASRARAVLTLGVCLLHGSGMTGAEAALRESAALAEAGGNPATALLARYWLATLYGRQGRLDDKMRTCVQAIRAGRTTQGPQPPLLGAAHIGIGEVWYERNDLERAQPAITEGLRLISGAIQHYIAGFGYVTLARIHQVRGTEEAALATFEEAEGWAARMQIESSSFRALLAAYRSRILLQQGNLGAALQWADTSGLDDQLRLSDERWLTLIRVRLAQYRQTTDQRLLDDLTGLVTRLRALAEEQGWTRLQIELLMLQALVVDAQGDLDCALGLLAAALAFATPEGYVRLFVDEGVPMATLLVQALEKRSWGRGDNARGQEVRAYADKLLAVLRAEGINLARGLQGSTFRPPPSAPGLEVLTERELEVLRLLAAGGSNRAIADELIIAIGTVKRHVNSIMGKLQVESRLEAVARAREFGLV